MMQLWPKIQDMGFCLIFISHNKQYHMSSESRITWVLFVPNITSLNVILWINDDVFYSFFVFFEQHSGV